MTKHSVLPFELDLGAPGIMRAVITRVDDGRCEVLTETGPLDCDVLEQNHRASMLERGDSVLVWHSGREIERGVIIGRIRAAKRGDAGRATETHARSSAPTNSSEVPDELVLEANRTLTLRVGNGSITIRSDGKILIKGSDVVSHAQRTNRIRGGAVSIN